MPPKDRTVAVIVRELIEHPFFPILFFGEFVKSLITESHTIEFGILAVISVLLWTFSDVVGETIEFLRSNVIGTRKQKEEKE